MPLAKALEVVEGEVIAREKEAAVEKRGGMAIREDEAVAVNPFGVPGVVAHDAVEEQIGNWCAAKWGTGMAAVGLLHCIHSQKPQSVDAQLHLTTSQI